MGKRRYKNTNILGTAFRIATTLIVVVLFAVGIYTISFFTNNFKESPTNFHLEVNGVFCAGKSSTIISDDFKEDIINIEVVYLMDKFLSKFSKEEGKNKGYSIKIIANAKFDFNINEVAYSFMKEGDLTQYFDIQKFETYFTLNLKDFTLQKLLEKKYGQAVVIPEDLEIPKDLLKLIILSEDEREYVEINFNTYIEVKGVSLDKEEIVYGN